MNKTHKFITFNRQSLIYWLNQYIHIFENKIKKGVGI